MGRLQDKVALVTGAGRGMGRATAELFAREGATVIGGDVRGPDTPYEGSVEEVVLDVTGEEDWKRVIGAIMARHERLDVLVNNAGIVTYEAITDLDLAGWDKIVAVNQTGVFLGMREAIPAMVKSGGGSIVNVSSIWGTVGVPGAHAYHATKGAVRTMTKNVAMTHVADGIRANSIHPGFIRTPLTDAQPADVNQLMVESTPMRRAGEPVEVAYGSLFLAGDESSFVTGIELDVDGGYLAQ